MGWCGDLRLLCQRFVFCFYFFAVDLCYLEYIPRGAILYLNNESNDGI